MIRRPSAFCRLLLTAAAGLFLPLSIAATTTEELKRALADRIAAIEQDPKAREAAIANGRERATFCAYCHGTDGNSTKPEIPNLASQNPTYLLDQIERFADGRRHDYTKVMQQLSVRLTPDEKLALVLYYANVPLKPAVGDLKRAQTGMPLYLSSCQACHGGDGRGLAGYARVAGQRPGYVVQTLKNYRDGKDRRLSHEMSTVTSGLSDAQIEALAAYIANLR